MCCEFGAQKKVYMKTQLKVPLSPKIDFSSCYCSVYNSEHTGFYSIKISQAFRSW